MPRDRGGGGHPGADQMRASALALATLEVAVARGSGTVARAQDVGIHPQTHRAAGAAPLETGVFEYPVEAFVLGLDLDRDAAGNDERAQPVLDLPSPDDVGRGAEVLDPRVGARAD